MSRGAPPPWLRDGDDRYAMNNAPPGHSRCGGNKVAGYDVSQEDWDRIFRKKEDVPCPRCGGRGFTSCAGGCCRSNCSKCRGKGTIESPADVPDEDWET